MFDTLLESRAAKSRSPGGALVSVTAHSALIAAAVLATMQAQKETPKPVDISRPFYLPRPLVESPHPPTKSPSEGAPRLPQPIQVNIPGSNFSPIEPRDLTSLSGALASPPIPVAISVGQPGGGAIDSGGIFQENQVEKPASVVPGNAAPRYPETLRSAGIEGRVVALFVVDELGRAEVDSVRFIHSDNRLFEDAVRVALRRMKFVAAETGGRKVRQLVQMPFVFTLDR
jgi:protein TonB